MNRFRKNKNQKGFTMIELMVVVVIVGILAAIAIPIYGKYIKNARLTEATGRMGEVITAAKAWAQENPTATGNPQWPAVGDVAGTIVSLNATENFTYTINSAKADATANDFEVQATGIAGKKMAGVTVVISVDNINLNGNPPVVTGL